MQKKTVASLAGVGIKKIWFDPDRLGDIKEAITKGDLRSLIKEGVIRIKSKRGISRSRVRKRIIQKRKGRRSSISSRKGKKGARLARKTAWILRVRSQRRFVKELLNKNLINNSTYRLLRNKIKGGFFRSRKHIKLFIREHNLFTKNGKGQKI
ncbi:MAG: 50S ribosomal protein L19e [Nanoarchaeota archaeon]